MTLQDLGNIGEFIAAVATLITLIYLAAQIRQNTGSVRAAAAQSVLAALNQANQSAASSPQQSRVVILGQADFNQLSKEERMQFMIWLFAWIRIVEQAYHSHLIGHLDSRIWHGHAKHTESIVQTPVFGRWWELRQSLFSPEFQEFINSLRSSSSPPPSTAGLVEAMTRDIPAA